MNHKVGAIYHMLSKFQCLREINFWLVHILANLARGLLKHQEVSRALCAQAAVHAAMLGFGLI